MATVLGMVEAESRDRSPSSPDRIELDWTDERYGDAAADLLGMLAYGEFRAFEKLSADAAMAPGMSERAAIAEMAVAEYGHFQRLCAALASHGRDPVEAMAPFEAAIDAFHQSTQPMDWLEGLIKAYVGDGIAMDFYRRIAAYVDPQTRDLVISVCDDLGHSDFVVGRVRQAIAADPKTAGRLALWGRRLVGEAFAQAQAVAVERDHLVRLVLAGGGGDQDELEDLFSQVTDAHVGRMRALGLEA